MTVILRINIVKHLLFLIVSIHRCGNTDAVVGVVVNTLFVGIVVGWGIHIVTFWFQPYLSGGMPTLWREFWSPWTVSLSKALLPPKTSRYRRDVETSYSSCVLCCCCWWWLCSCGCFVLILLLLVVCCCCCCCCRHGCFPRRKSSSAV